MPPDSAADSIEVVGDVARVNALRDPSGEAVVDGDRRLTWAQLDARVTRLANALRTGLGIASGERVCIVSSNRLEYYELFHATAVVGIVAVPLNQRLSSDELVDIVRRVRPRAILHDRGHADVARELADVAPAEVVLVDLDGGPSATSYEEMLRAGSRARPRERPAAGDAATICFTGGTTGAPKGCVISHGALVENARVMPVTHGLKAGDRHLFVRPMAVAPGHRMVAWHGYLGGTTVITERFDATAFASQVERERVNATLLSPTMFQMLLDEGRLETHDLSSLRSVSYGGAPITPDLLAQVTERLDCDLHQNYGGTEAAVATHLTPADHHAGRLDSVGRAAPHVDLRLVDEDGHDVPAGAAGEVLVRSAQLFSEYWEDPDTTARVLEDGFYWTGDLGVMDEAGYLSLVGRTKDMIISGGFNVYPIEVENVLAEHRGVKEVAVIGLPDSRWGEAVHAVVVRAPGESVTADELTEYCRSRIASFKKPRSIEFVDALPRTTVGKVAKQVLRRAAVEGGAAPTA